MYMPQQESAARAGEESYALGDVCLDVGARLLTRGGEVVPLLPKTFELLLVLVRRAPGVVTRQELLDTVWPHEAVNDEALTQRLMLLRRELGDDPKHPTYIASVPRWGYRLVAPVQRLEPGGPALPQAPPADSTTARVLPEDNAPALATSPPAAAVTRARYGRGSLAWPLAPVTIGLLVVGVYLARGQRQASDSIAILPFALGTADPGTDVLGDGVRETLTTSLGRLPRLKVIAASSTSRFKGDTTDPQRLGRELGVRTVVTGRIVKQGDTLAVSAELVSVEDGAQLWGGSFVRPLSDLFVVQDDLAAQIALSLRPKLALAERDLLRRRYTDDLVAYQLYMKGRYHWNKRSVQGFEDAIACFKQAIHEDPAYALAYAGLADCYALLGAAEYGAQPPREALPKARAAAERALEIDPQLAEAYASLGLVQRIFDWDRAAAERSLRRAIELAPSYASAHQWYGETLAENGRLREAEGEIRRALELDPLSLVINADLGMLAYYARDYERAIQYYQATLAMEPFFVPARLGLALAQSQLGDHAQALAALAEARTVAVDEPVVLATLAYLQARAGRPDEARATAALIAAAGARRYVAPYYLAAAPLGFGDVDAALSWLGKAAGERCSLLGSLAVDPAFDPLRSDPRFAELLHRAGLAH
jgi:TolB-like protein/DNA-binding winged helix-turn-helix (wHTH) protein/Tfp pilus assembly protein PilF